MRLYREVKMRTGKLAGVAVILIAGPAFGLSSVSFELELGGSNNGTSCNATNLQFFTPGLPGGGETYTIGDVITWDSRITATGVHSGDGAADGLAIRGVANFVFDLALYKDSVSAPNLVTNAQFTSIAGAGCPVTAAKFAFVYDIFAFGGKGRVIDELFGTDPDGGPLMATKTYPTSEPGVLLGMGAGYSQWKRSGSFATFTTAGIGQVAPDPGDPSGGPLGTGPVCEGQLDTGNLVAGMYILDLTPGGGINVLRGDKNLDNDQNAFAVAANTTAGDQLIFWLQAGGAGAVVDSYASVRFHGGAVAQEIEFDLGDGSLSGSATGVDPRLPVGSTIIRAETSGAVPTLSGADAVATDVDTLATYNGTVSLNGTTLDATFSPPLPSVTTPNVAAKAYCVDFGPAVSNWDGAADTDVMFRLITGDATGDAKTLLNDFALIKLSVQAGNPVLPGRERQDLNGNGAIELADVAIAKLHNGELHNGVASCP